MASQAQIETQETLLSDCVEALSKWKDLIDEHCSGDIKTVEMNHLKDIVKNFCTVDSQAKLELNAAQEIANLVENGEVEDDFDIDKAFEEKLHETSEDFHGSQIWQKVFNQYTRQSDVQQIEKTEEDNLNDSQYDEVDDSLMCSNVFTPPVDPISKQIIKNPYKNRTCGHIYEYSFILQYIKAMKNKAKCPFIGCKNNNLTASELRKDTQTQKLIQEYLKNQSQSQTS